MSEEIGVKQTHRLREIVNWLRTKADEASKQAASRLESEKDRNATVAELKQARALAEKMAGRKLPDASIDVEAHKAYCDMQVRVGRKLAAEAKQLWEWADFLETLEPIMDALHTIVDLESLNYKDVGQKEIALEYARAAIQKARVW